MSIIRIKKNRDFVVLHKGCLQNPNLSLKAKGLWAYCLAQPDDWNFHIRQLSTVLKEGREAISSALKELIKYGYCKTIQNKDEYGRFETFDYEIHETSMEIKDILPIAGLPIAGFSVAENPAILSNDLEEEITKKNLPPLTPPISKEELMMMMISLKWTQEEFEKGWQRYLKQPEGKVTNPQKWLISVMQSIRLEGQKKAEVHLQTERNKVITDKAQERLKAQHLVIQTGIKNMGKENQEFLEKLERSGFKSDLYKIDVDAYGLKYITLFKFGEAGMGTYDFTLNPRDTILIESVKKHLQIEENNRLDA